MKKIPDILKEKAIGFVFNLVSLLVIVIVLLLVIWAFAAFTEPSAAPSASNQDFAQNILGADNNNNSFASTNVAANADGSVIERLEELQGKAIGTTDVGAMTGSLTGSVPEIIKYLYDRVAGTTDVGGVTGSITGSVPEMIDYLWDNKGSFGSGGWTQCAYFSDTAGNDIDATWEDGCSAYNEVLFVCKPNSTMEGYSGPFNNSPSDLMGFSDNTSGVAHKFWDSTNYFENIPNSNIYTGITSVVLFRVYHLNSGADEGYNCANVATNTLTGDEYWIYGR